jgi:hypothetical protein
MGEGPDLIGLGHFDGGDEDVVEPHHPTFDDEGLLLYLVCKQLPPARR